MEGRGWEKERGGGFVYVFDKTHADVVLHQYDPWGQVKSMDYYLISIAPKLIRFCSGPGLGLVLVFLIK